MEGKCKALDECMCVLICCCSGLFLKPDIARLTADLLLTYADMPPDIIIQKCLMGQLSECSMCRDTLVTSKTLLMYHIGYNTSTSDDRVYKQDEFQCGWRHPFVSSLSWCAYMFTNPMPRTEIPV